MTSDTPVQPHRDVLMGALARWPLTLALVLVGAFAGYLVAVPRADVVTVETRLTVGANDLAAYQIAGFAVGAEALAANYARYASDSPTVRALLDKDLGTASADRVETIVSSPIPDSNVVRVEVTSVDQKVAARAATAIANYLVVQTADKTAATQTALLREHRALSLRIIKLQDRLATSDPGNKTDESDAHLATLKVRQTAIGVAYQQSLISSPPESSLRIIQAPTVTAHSKGRQRELYAVAGAVVGFAVALVLASPRIRFRRRSRDAHHT